jgi:hypothetical protein
MPVKKAAAKKVAKKPVKKAVTKKPVKKAAKKPAKKVVARKPKKAERAKDVVVTPVVDASGVVTMNPVEDDVLN